MSDRQGPPLERGTGQEVCWPCEGGGVVGRGGRGGEGVRERAGRRGRNGNFF